MTWCNGDTTDFDSVIPGSNPGVTSKIKVMKKEIEWFEEDGCLGGQRGLVFDLDTNLITKWNGDVEKLSKNNLSDVEWCIEMNLNSIIGRISNIHSKLNQKETKNIKIDGGYKISKPLNENQRISYNNKLNKLTSELEWLKSISLKPIE